VSENNIAVQHTPLSAGEGKDVVSLCSTRFIVRDATSCSTTL